MITSLKLVSLVGKFPGLDASQLRDKGFLPRIHGSLNRAKRDGELRYHDGGWFLTRAEAELAEAEAAKSEAAEVEAEAEAAKAEAAEIESRATEDQSWIETMYQRDFDIDIRGDKCRLGIDAPARISVHRSEVHAAIKRDAKINQATREVNEVFEQGEDE